METGVEDQGQAVQANVSDPLVSRIAAQAGPLVAALGMELVETQFRLEGQRWVLRFFINRAGGVTVDDCAAVSRRLDDWLEEAALIRHAYTLEVSSPGLERPLRKPEDFVRFAGRRVRLRLHRDEGQGKTLTGTLLGLENGEIALLMDNKEKLGLRMEQIARARLTLD